MLHFYSIVMNLMKRIPSSELTYTGIQINNYLDCRRKLWLAHFAHRAFLYTVNSNDKL